MADKVRYCRAAGCHKLTSTVYCPDHKPLEKQAKANKHHNPFYDSKEWRKLRARHLKAHPLCQRCNATEGRTQLARHVHHIKPVRSFPQLALDPDNLQALCRRCHDDLTTQERREKNKPYDFGRSKRQPIRRTVMKGRR